MKIFSKKKDSVSVGLDIGSFSIKVIQLEHLPNGDAKLLGYSMKEIPREAIVEKEIRDHEGVLDSIQTAIEKVDPAIREVSISLCGRRVFTDILQVKIPKKKENLRESIMVEAEQKLPMGTEGLTIDYDIIKESPDGETAEVVMVAVHSDFLRDYVLLLQDGGYHILGVDVDYISLYNVLKQNIDIETDDPQVIINIGHSITNLTFIQNKVYQGVRDISSGTLDIWRSLQNRFRITPEDIHKLMTGASQWEDPAEFQSGLFAATDELKMGLDMAFSYFENLSKGQSISRLYITGGGTLIPFLTDIISEKLEIPHQILDPFSRLVYEPSLFTNQTPDKVSPMFSVAVGLALRRD
ncbi:type IV pilus assembly protein PilM [bacterium]|nr:type IV pilus assembly protein PilM [bacterium]